MHGVLMFEKFLELFKKKEEKEPEYKCPKCGSDRIGYFTGISNYIQVVLGEEEPKYVKSATCLDCGFRSISGVDDTSDTYLKDFELR